MFDKLEEVEKRYEELTKMISDPEVIARTHEWQKLMKEHAEIEEVVNKYREYKKQLNIIEESKSLMEDKDLRELAEVEMLQAKDKLPNTGTMSILLVSIIILVTATVFFKIKKDKYKDI